MDNQRIEHIDESLFHSRFMKYAESLPEEERQLLLSPTKEIRSLSSEERDEEFRERLSNLSPEDFQEFIDFMRYCTGKTDEMPKRNRN